ncbi:alpha/beta hydrolase [Hymenobacter sp. B1770]|uniref:alpha/beta hydrolase n=1 Tax=Hymenobacter sp. B1770 TaxID=1718788 RepID=UPI003CF413F1
MYDNISFSNYLGAITQQFRSSHFMHMLTRLLTVAIAALTTIGVCAQTARPSLTGNWVGTVAGTEFTLHLSDPPTGPRTATLDIPEQNAKGIQLQFTAPGDSVYLRLAQPVAQFAGLRSPDGQQLVGVWRQGMREFAFTITRAGSTAKPAGPRRPQTPQPPFPYQSADITFRNEKAGVTLAGTYTVPADMGPFAAVVLLTGSGAQDRNSSIFGHQLFAVLADHLTRQGIAVLRFDDRGVGQSGGAQKGMTSADYTTDALAALAWLRAQPGIRKSQVGLLGHSQGGTAAVGAAAQPGGPDFLVLLASPALPGDEMIVQQAKAIATAYKADPIQIELIEGEQRQIIDIIKKTPDNVLARAELLRLLNRSHSTNPAMLAQLNSQLDVLTSPFYRDLLADRPAQTLAKVRCPVLAMGGSKDVQVPVKANLTATAAGLKAAGNRDVTLKEIPGLNHLFQTANTGGPTEYGTINETFAPAALQVVSDWISQRTKK